MCYIILKRGDVMKLKEYNFNLYNAFNDEINYGINKDDIIVEGNNNFYYWDCVNGHTHRARLNKMLKGADCIYCLHEKQLLRSVNKKK